MAGLKGSKEEVAALSLEIGLSISLIAEKVTASTTMEVNVVAAHPILTDLEEGK